MRSMEHIVCTTTSSSTLHSSLLPLSPSPSGLRSFCKFHPPLETWSLSAAACIPGAAGRLSSQPLSDVKVKRRPLMKGIATTVLATCSTALVDAPAKGMEKIPFKPEGYNFWTWRGHKVHYVFEGDGVPVVLIHGFGASAFHWRYNIPELAKNFKVYAIDLLGFGLTDKALIDYDAFVWRDQVADFIKEVVRIPAILVGNSVGGLTALQTAARYPELVSGLALLNSSGQFESAVKEEKKQVREESIVQKHFLRPFQEWLQRLAIMFTFWQAKQPARIRSVLNKVYIDKTNVDDYLVDSIVLPAQDANAGEVYYRMMIQFMFRPSNVSMNQLLTKLSCPLLLLWGDLDPWMGPTKADKIKELYPEASIVRLQAGHCPHDEAPEMVNNALTKWVLSLPPNESQLVL